MRLSWKINGALIVVISSVLVSQAWLRISREEAWLDAEMWQDHHILARAIRPAIEDDWRDQGEQAAVQLANRLGVRDEGVRVRIVWPGRTDPEGSPDIRDLAAHALASNSEVSTTVEAEDPGWRYTYVPLDAAVTTTAVLELRETHASVEAFTDHTRVRASVWLVALIALTTLIVVVLVQTLVVRPLGMLSEHARRIASGELDARVGPTSADELGALGRELDAMGMELAAAAARLKREQSARERALEQLRHADRLMSVGQLAAGVAHELGTPLNVVIVRAKMIAQGEVASPEEASAFAKTIVQQGERMATIIRQLLGFARPAAPSLTPTQVGSAVNQVLGLIAPSARSLGVAVEVELVEDHTLPLDPQQFEQVLLNLLTNALHATSAGGTVKVTVDRSQVTPPTTVQTQGSEWIALTVADSGSGIAPENLGRVFEPFFTTKDVGKGTGLGLSVSYGIIREHGGWIEVESTPGSGASFTVYLPWNRPA